MFQRDCPGCGLTRSFIYLAHGDWRGSVAVHRFGWLLALGVVLQIPYRMLVLWKPALALGPVWTVTIFSGVAVLLAANWIYNMVTKG